MAYKVVDWSIIVKIDSRVVPKTSLAALFTRNSSKARGAFQVLTVSYCGLPGRRTSVKRLDTSTFDPEIIASPRAIPNRSSYREDMPSRRGERLVYKPENIRPV